MVGLIFLASNYYIWLSMKRIQGVENVTNFRASHDRGYSDAGHHGVGLENVSSARMAIPYLSCLASYLASGS